MPIVTIVLEFDEMPEKVDIINYIQDLIENDCLDYSMEEKDE